MSLDERLPRDWRAALVVAALTVGAVKGFRDWVIQIASAQDAPQRQAIEQIRPMVKAVWSACVKRGECPPIPEPER